MTLDLFDYCNLFMFRRIHTSRCKSIKKCTPYVLHTIFKEFFTF